MKVLRTLMRLIVGAFDRGGTSHQVNVERLATLPYKFSEFDLALAWDIRAAGNETVVEGVLKNRRYALMEGIELWVSVADNAGKMSARSVCYVMPHQVRQDEIVPFALKLPVHLEAGSALKFTYKYRGSDGGEGGVDWMQTFDWTIPES